MLTVATLDATVDGKTVRVRVVGECKTIEDGGVRVTLHADTCPADHPATIEDPLPIEKEWS